MGVVQTKGKFICVVYFLISVITLCLIVSAVTTEDFIDYTLLGVYLSLVFSVAYMYHGDKKNKWVMAFLVVGFCEVLGKHMIEEGNNQLVGSYYILCYLTIFLLMQISLFLENDPTGFTQGVAFGFFFRFFMVFVVGGWEVRSDEALHAAAVVIVAILARVTEAPDEPAYVVEGY